MKHQELIIDLREEHELLQSLLVSKNINSEYEIINIPSRHIFANIDWINHQTELRPVWLICASGRRSLSIKKKYFAKNDGIKSSEGGVKLVQMGGCEQGNNGESVKGCELKLNYGAGGFGMQQYMQLVFAAMLAIVAVLLHFNVKKHVLMMVVGAMIVMVLAQALTKSCLLGNMVEKSVFVPKNTLAE